jgi:predicted Zn-dependent protease
MTRRLVQGSVLLLALAIAAWFVIGVRQARDTSRATAIISGTEPLSQSQAQRAASLLHAAAFLNPDRQVDLLRAELADRRGDRGEAQRMLFTLVGKEPMNAQVWAALANIGTTPAVRLRAYAEVTRLVRVLPSAG